MLYFYSNQFKQQHSQQFSDYPLAQNYLQASRFSQNHLNSTFHSQSDMKKSAQIGSIDNQPTDRELIMWLIRRLGYEDEIHKHFSQKKQLQNSDCSIQQNFEYHSGSKDLIKSSRTIQVLINGMDKNSNFLIIDLLNLIKLFSRFFAPSFSRHIKKLITTYQEMGLSDDQIMQYLPFAYFLLATNPNCQFLLQIKGAVCVKYLFNPKSVSNRYLYFLNTQIVTNFRNYFDVFKSHYGKCSNFYLVIIQMLTNLGYQSFINEEKVKLIVKRHIKYLFLGSVNLWKEGQYLLIGLILRILKPVQRKEYDRLKKCIEERSLFQKDRMEYIIQTLGDVQIQKYRKAY